MDRTYIAIAALALVAGCGGPGDDAGVAEPGGVATEEQGVPKVSEGVSEGPAEGEEWEREYHAPEDILAELQAGGVECETEDDSAPTMYSLRSQFCYVNEDRTEGYTASVYGSPAQQGEAHVYLTEANPGVQYVWGTGWSVSLPFDSDGSEVTDVLGGTVDGG